MTKAEFVEIFSKKTELSKEKTAKLITDFFETIIEELEKGNDVEFVKFAKFKKTIKAERKISPTLTKGKEMTLPKREVVKVALGSEFKKLTKEIK